MWVYVGMQVQGYIDLQVNCPIVRVLSVYILLTVRACYVKFVVFEWISQNKNLFQNCRLKQVLM